MWSNQNAFYMFSVYALPKLCGYNVTLIKYLLFNLVSKWCESDGGQFEMLYAEGYSNNGYEEEDTQNEMSQCKPDTKKQYPYHIHKRAQAADSLRFAHNLSAKWP